MLRLVVTFLLISSCPAQSKEKIKRMTPTSRGSTGLFNVFVPDTLREGEVSLSLSGIHFNREPGDLDFTLYPLSITVGVNDRLEFFASWEAHRRVNADGLELHKVAPDGPVVPARLSGPNRPVAYSSDAPFLDVGFSAAPGELWTGFKLNLLSERKGMPVGLAIQPVIKLPLSRTRTRLLRGLTNGAIEGGYDLILSKSFGTGTLTGQYGFLFAEDSEGIDLQDRLNYGVGYEQPLGTSKVSTVFELVGTHFLGEKVALANPKSPLDFYSGLRFSPSPRLSISAALNFTLRRIDPTQEIYQIPSTGRLGWFAQVSFHRKVNRPPTIQCSPSLAVVSQGQLVSIRVLISDPDDDFLSLAWTADGGTISQQDSTVIFNTTEVQAGRYTVVAEVGDGEHTATCSAQITVKQKGVTQP